MIRVRNAQPLVMLVVNQIVDHRGLNIGIVSSHYQGLNIFAVACRILCYRTFRKGVYTPLGTYTRQDPTARASRPAQAWCRGLSSMQRSRARRLDISVIEATNVMLEMEHDEMAFRRQHEAVRQMHCSIKRTLLAVNPFQLHFHHDCRQRRISLAYSCHNSDTPAHYQQCCAQVQAILQSESTWLSASLNRASTMALGHRHDQKHDEGGSRTTNA